MTTRSDPATRGANLKSDSVGTNRSPIRVLGGRRGALTFAIIVFATTVVQVLYNPLIVMLTGAASNWTHPLQLGMIALLALLLCAAQTGALLLSVRAPALSLLITAACYVGITVLGVPNWGQAMQFVVAVSMFLFSAQRPLRVGAVWLAVVTAIAITGLIGYSSSTGASVGVSSGFIVQQALSFFTPVAGATALGAWWAARSRRIEHAQASAEAAAREHDERVELARAQERARIGQELHDVAAQHIAGLLSLADAAIDIEPRNPAEALRLIDDIRLEGRFASASIYGALRDLRRMDGQRGEPTPDLMSLPELLAYWRKRGARLESRVLGDLSFLPAVVSTCAYRGVQEALTNAAKHAPGAAVSVEIAIEEQQLRIVVENGPGDRALSAGEPIGLGWGLEGLRDRLRLLSGTVEAAPTPDGGWQVRMDMPVIEIETRSAHTS